MYCPRCQADQNFRKELFEGVEIDHCYKCQGVWLDEGELIKILENKEEKFSDEVISEAINTTFAGIPKEEKRSQEKCPLCSKSMKAVNYSYDSGIIIDRCDEHGIWLDSGELQKIQAYKEHMDDKAETHRDEWLKLANAIQEADGEALDEKKKTSYRPTKYFFNSLISKLIGRG